MGWFEGLRQGRFCGWTWLPSDPGRTLDVVLTASDRVVTVRADRFRADLQRAGLAEGCYGFSVAIADLPGYRGGVSCGWADLGLALPGSPWSSPVSPGANFTQGRIRLRVDAPLLGDRRLTGFVFDASDPLLRMRLGAVCGGDFRDEVVASLYRSLDADEAGDGFHGFSVSLPAPLRLLEGGVRLVDVGRDQLLARLGPRSF